MSAKKLREMIIEAAELLHDEENLTIQVDVEDDDVILAVKDSKDILEYVSFEGDASACLIELGTTIVTELETKVETINDDFERDFHSELEDLYNGLKNGDISQWKELLEESKDDIDSMIKRLSKNSDDYDNSSEMIDMVDNLKLEIERFEASLPKVVPVQTINLLEEVKATNLPEDVSDSNAELN
jgi:hypothetical protein